jgi:hypothetical protein
VTSPLQFQFHLYDIAPGGKIVGTLDIADITNIHSVNYGTEDNPLDNSHTVTIHLSGAAREFVVRSKSGSNSQFLQNWGAVVGQQLLTLDLYDTAPAGKRVGTLEVADVSNIRSIRFGTSDNPLDNQHCIVIKVEGSLNEFVVRARSTSNAQLVQDWIDTVGQQPVGGNDSQLESAAGAWIVPLSVSVGDVVYGTGTNTADRADNGSVTTGPAFGVVTAKPTGVTATVAYLGEIGAFAGLTGGLDYWLGLLGAVTSVPLDPQVEAGTGKISQYLGRAKNATTLIFDPGPDIVM